MSTVQHLRSPRFLELYFHCYHVDAHRWISPARVAWKHTGVPQFDFLPPVHSRPRVAYPACSTGLIRKHCTGMQCGLAVRTRASPSLIMKHCTGMQCGLAVTHNYITHHLYLTWARFLALLPGGRITGMRLLGSSLVLTNLFGPLPVPV